MVINAVTILFWHHYKYLTFSSVVLFVVFLFELSKIDGVPIVIISSQELKYHIKITTCYTYADTSYRFLQTIELPGACSCYES